MQRQTTTSAAPEVDAIRYLMRPAAVCHDGVSSSLHLVAASRHSVLGYGTRRIRTGEAVVLTVDGLEIAARVGGSDGRRIRFDLDQDGAGWALPARASVDQHRSRTAANDAEANDPSGTGSGESRYVAEAA